MAQTGKKINFTELEKIEEIIFKNGDRQISKKELNEIQSRLKKNSVKAKRKSSRLK